MKIREGRFYGTRDGQKVGPIERGTSSSEARYWTAKSVLDGGFFSWWFKDGSFWPDGHEMRTANNAANDIIAEWSDPMDLTTITTPFGLLDRETQEALKGHGGAYEGFGSKGVWVEGVPVWSPGCVYRVKPTPAPPKPREWHFNPEAYGHHQLHPHQDLVPLPPGWIHVIEKLPK